LDRCEKSRALWEEGRGWGKKKKKKYALRLLLSKKRGRGKARMGGVYFFALEGANFIRGAPGTAKAGNYGI